MQRVCLSPTAVCNFHAPAKHPTPGHRHEARAVYEGRATVIVAYHSFASETLPRSPQGQIACQKGTLFLAWHKSVYTERKTTMHE